MSISLKNIPKMSKLLDKKDLNLSVPIKREESTGKSQTHLSLKYSFYNNIQKQSINTDLCILNFITNESERKYSGKTSISDSIPNKFNYELQMINKYDENLNSSLSFISEFDLEDEEENLENDSFDSCDNDVSEIEQIEIKKSSKNVLDDRIEDEECSIKLEKEWNDIQEFLLNKK